MYWFGHKTSGNEWMKEESWTLLKEKKSLLQRESISSIIECLDGFSHCWDPDTVLFKTAVDEIEKEYAFSREEIIKTLGLLPGLLSKESLEKRLHSEFGNIGVLDNFTKTQNFQGKVKAVPHGTLLHVTAGNVFLSSIDSLIMGFLTKNISILKVSSNNKFFPRYFAENFSLYDQKKILSDKYSVLHWKGGDQETEAFIKHKVNAIIAWGGEEMIESYRIGLPVGVKFLDFGPKISIQAITANGIKDKNLKLIAEYIVKDIIPWNQGACSSPQNLYLQTGINHIELMKLIDAEFELYHQERISEDEATEILKEKFRGYYSEAIEDGALSEGSQHLLHYEKNKLLRPSPLNSSLIIKNFDHADDLAQSLEPFLYYLQSCSYLVSTDEKENFLSTLASVGIKRFAPLGTITFGMDGAPHDGRFVLRELVNFIGDEARLLDYGATLDSIQTSSELKNHFEMIPHPKGYIFSSGGTTGAPKFVHFSYEEFDAVTDLLAYNLKAQGLEAGMTIANLFVAGNLWSSFLAVDKALQKIGAIQLPIGGLCPSENVLFYLNKFKPDAIMGLPSLLVLNAELSEAKGMDLHVPKVFYAGEALSEPRRAYLKKVWKTDYFGSSGYASVDAGVIGYQCLHCGPGEHHLFSEFVDLKIINDEAIVTSSLRSTLPIVNYSTGDRVSWIVDCQCGRRDRRFKLMGRIDSLIQIWSCRIMLEEIEKSLQKLDPEVITFQISLSEEIIDGRVKEKMMIVFEGHKDQLSKESMLRDFYSSSRDLKDTISFEEFSLNADITMVRPGEIPRNPRTGKISVILDQRH